MKLLFQQGKRFILKQGRGAEAHLGNNLSLQSLAFTTEENLTSSFCQEKQSNCAAGCLQIYLCFVLQVILRLEIRRCQASFCRQNLCNGFTFIQVPALSAGNSFVGVTGIYREYLWRSLPSHNRCGDNSQLFIYSAAPVKRPW